MYVHDVFITSRIWEVSWRSGLLRIAKNIEDFLLSVNAWFLSERDNGRFLG